MSNAGRDFAKATIVTLVPTGLGFLVSGWVAGIVCLFIAGSLSCILWTPLGRWLGLHADGEDKPLADELDALIREGMELRKELAAPVEPVETKPGNWLIEGGAPDSWWEKVDAFDERVRGLLRAERPGLLHTYAEGHNTYVRTRREMQADDASDTTEDKRPNHERVLAFVNATRRGPVRLMDALLEGVSAARRQFGLETGQ